jgi:hypothetical protein
MTLTLRNTTISALALLVVCTLGAQWLYGSTSAGGVAAAGGLILVNFVLWQRVGHAFMSAALQGRSPVLAVVLWGAKLTLLIGGLLFLLANFPPLAVTVGASVVVASILLLALGSTASELRLEGT